MFTGIRTGIPRSRYGSKRESLLQQACIGAWDCQEASGPLLPAKGGLSIPVVGSPATTTGPATGITSRACATGVDYFQVADNEIFRAPSSGQKTIRVWYKDRRTGGSHYIHSKTNATNLLSPGGEYALNVVNGGASGRFRLGDDSARVSIATAQQGHNHDDWIRHEVLFDADNENITLRTYRPSTDTEEMEIVAVAGGVFVGTNPFVIGDLDGEIALVLVLNRAFSPVEREADKTPTRYADLGK